MPLESLLELVETLRKRIGGHRAALSGNEMLTRYALVDPLLCALGWDTADPAIVIPEDTSGLGRGRPDYVLQNNGQPAMVIEAKKLGSGLQDGTRQAVAYAMDANRQARYFAITDGQHWEIYDTNRPARNMRAASFDIMAAAPAEVCLKAMALWRPNVEVYSVMVAETPIVGLEDIQQRLVAKSTTLNAASGIVQDGTDASNWVLLSDLSPKGGDTPPVEIQFPDNRKVALGKWNLVVVESSRWLYTNNYLNASNCRIQRATRYIVSDAPIHPNGKKFTMPIDVGSLYVEVNYSGLNHVKNARMIIEHAGQDPSQFKVRLR